MAFHGKSWEKPVKSDEIQTTRVSDALTNLGFIGTVVGGAGYALKAGANALAGSTLPAQLALEAPNLDKLGYYGLIGGGVLIGATIAGVAWYYLLPTAGNMKRSIYATMLDAKSNNLVHDGKIPPRVKVKLHREGVRVVGADVTISLASLAVDKQDVSPLKILFNSWLFRDLIVTSNELTPRQNAVVFHLEKFNLDNSLTVEHLAELDAGVGRVRVDKNVVVDMIESPHIALSASTGSGKTVTLEMLMHGLLQPAATEPDDETVKLYGGSTYVEPKGGLAEQLRLTGRDFGRNAVISSFDEDWLKSIVMRMEALDELIKAREAYMARHGVKWFEVFPVAFLAIDETVDVIGRFKNAKWADKDEEKRFGFKAWNDLLTSLISRGRSSGVIVIISTVSANSQQIPVMWRDNLQTKIQLRPNTDNIGFLFPQANKDLAKMPYQVGQGLMSGADNDVKRVQFPHLADIDVAVTELAQRLEENGHAGLKITAPELHDQSTV